MTQKLEKLAQKLGSAIGRKAHEDHLDVSGLFRSIPRRSGLAEHVNDSLVRRLEPGVLRVNQPSWERAVTDFFVMPHDYFYVVGEGSQEGILPPDGRQGIYEIPELAERILTDRLYVREMPVMLLANQVGLGTYALNLANAIRAEVIATPDHAPVLRPREIGPEVLAFPRVRWWQWKPKVGGGNKPA